MTDLAGFLLLAIVIIVTPGPDTTLTIRNTLIGGRAAGIATAVGVSCGQAFWSIATSAGIVALLVAAEPLFLALRFAGAAYLVLLGALTLWSAWHAEREIVPPRAGGLRPPIALRQGVISNLTNPKMAVFFPSLLPQFVSPGQTSFAPLLTLGLAFCLMTLAWLSLYAVAIAGAGALLRRRGIGRALEAIAGTVLVGLGIRVAVTR